MGMQHRRRKATREELAQGEREMRKAPARLERERLRAAEIPIEDEVTQETPLQGAIEARASTEVEVFDPAAGAQVEVSALRTPTAVPKALGPPGSNEREPQADRTTQVLAAPLNPEEVLVEPKTNAEEVQDPQLTQTPKPIASDDRREPPRQGTPMGGGSATSFTPLLTDDQLRRFQDIYSQAPWIYPHFNQMQPAPSVPASAPPLRRPLFLEQGKRCSPHLLTNWFTIFYRRIND